VFVGGKGGRMKGGHTQQQHLAVRCHRLAPARVSCHWWHVWVGGVHQSSLLCFSRRLSYYCSRCCCCCLPTLQSMLCLLSTTLCCLVLLLIWLLLCRAARG
jgi:hypothetical protein